jgi:hypothetical protein
MKKNWYSLFANVCIVVTVVANVVMIRNNVRLNNKLEAQHAELLQEQEAAHKLLELHRDYLRSVMRIDNWRMGLDGPVMRVPNRVPVPDPALFRDDCEASADRCRKKGEE